MSNPGTTRISPLALAAAFAAIYLVWGSTYVAIKIGIETMPPFLMAGFRFLAAGAPLYLFLRLRGTVRPSRAHWLGALLIGTLMLACGNGLVTRAEKIVPSGIAAVIIATVPLWMTVLEVWPFRRSTLSVRVIAGLACGLVGVAVLIAPTGDQLGAIDAVGAAMLFLAALSWSIGSLLSRSARLPAQPLMAAAMQMIAGGAVLLLWGTAAGEWTGFAIGDVSLRSVTALIYLITFGSILALGCYVWLLRVTSASAVSTYAFVNPLVALWLGGAIAGEAIGPRAWLATLLIVGGVAFLQGSRALSGWRPSGRRAAAEAKPAIAPAEISERC